MRRLFRSLLALHLLILLSACGILPKGGGDKATTVTVTPAGESKPHTLSAAVIITPTGTFRSAILESGAGLRTGGERKGIRVRYGVLDSAAEEFLLRALQAGDAPFSATVGLAAGNEAQIRSGRTQPDRGSCTAHVLPHGTGDSLEYLDLGIVAKPADGSLLPVVRGRVPVSGSGTYLICFESGTGEAFSAFLRLDLAGTARAAGTQTHRSHRLAVRSFVVKTTDLSRILRIEEIEERGGLGGIVVESLTQEQAASLAKALVEDATAGPKTNRIIAETATTALQAGGLNLEIGSSFAPSLVNYTTSVTVKNRGTLPPLTVTHSDREVLLLLGWDAESPGTSTAALIELAPVD